MTLDKRTRKQLLAHCGQLQEDDCVDPREFFKTSKNNQKQNRKAKQLCRQVASTLDLVLSGDCHDETLQSLHVVTVVPAPDASRLLEFQADQENRLWLMVHSGSRAMGQAITAHHVSRATKSTRGLLCLDAESERGRAYLDDVAWARSYARQNRLAMVVAACRLLADLFGIASDESSLIEGDHNHVRRETHFGKQLWVHRKGAQSALLDEPGIIPGSMGTSSFHVAGRGCADALRSSSHGAGRKLARSDAKRSIGKRQFHREMQAVWFDHRRADALRDEAPSAYKDIHAVMRAQRELTRIVREVRPLLSYKGV